MNRQEHIRRILREELNQTTFSFSDDELYEIAKWGLEDEYSTSGCWDDTDNIEVAIECAVEDFKYYLSNPYPVELGNIPSKPIIYRLVRLKDVNDLRKELEKIMTNITLSNFHLGTIQNMDYFESFE